MYSPATVAAREQTLLATPRWQALRDTGLPTYSLADTAALTDALVAARTPEGRYTRRLAPEEALFLHTTPLKCAIDFEYFVTRFVWIDDQGHGLRRLSPLSESQTYVLGRLAALEAARWGVHPDGLLVNVLKARQLYISTLSEALVAHRILFQPHTRGLSGADVEDQAGYLFRMVVRLVDHLPYFLKPARLTFVKNRETSFENGSFLKTAWGQSTRGALQAVSGTEGSKGAIGRGMTFSTIHISELATWANPQQLDAALLPAIPVHHDTLVLFESTAEHAGDWWHQHWQTSASGVGRFTNIFVPVYAEPSKYALPPPPHWVPSSSTLAWATRCERTSTQWLPRAVTLSRDQLYWYETTRAFYEQKGDYGTFAKEFCADDIECFQYAGRSIFTFAQLDAIDAAGAKRPLLDVWKVEPARDIAALRRLPEDDTAPGAGASREALAPAPPGRPPARPLPPLSMRIPQPTSKLAAETFPIPPGYGFQRLTPTEVAALPSLRESVLAIWEYPRPRGRRRYVMSVDVSDGLGQDCSVIDLIRLPTFDEPAEQVAQYVSKTVDTQQLAFVCDAIGRLYPDEDGVEALAAIETNGHGLATQDTLQLHLGYSHFYVWEYADAASPDRRYSTRIGWVTTTRTRPILLASFRDAITNVDPITGQPDFILNSPITRAELRHFITPGPLAEAQAARGQHDDAILAAAIGYYVAWRLAGGEAEPLSEKRHRKAARDRQAALTPSAPPNARCQALTAEEADAGHQEDDEFADAGADPLSLYFDARQHE